MHLFGDADIESSNMFFCLQEHCFVLDVESPCTNRFCVRQEHLKKGGCCTYTYMYITYEQVCMYVCTGKIDWFSSQCSFIYVLTRKPVLVHLFLHSEWGIGYESSTFFFPCSHSYSILLIEQYILEQVHVLKLQTRPDIFLLRPESRLE